MPAKKGAPKKPVKAGESKKGKPKGVKKPYVPTGKPRGRPKKTTATKKK